MYISELWQAMIILKNGNVLEVVYPFNSAYWSSWVLQNPIFHQIKTQLQKIEKPRSESLIIIGFKSSKTERLIWLINDNHDRWLISYLIFCKTHLDNPSGIVDRVKRVIFICLPPVKIGWFFPMSISCCHFWQHFSYHFSTQLTNLTQPLTNQKPLISFLQRLKKQLFMIQRYMKNPINFCWNIEE